MMFSFAFSNPGGHPGNELKIEIPLLRGEARESLMGPAEPAGREGTVSLWSGKGSLMGISRTQLAGDLEAATHRAYEDIVRAARGLNLHRIWNFVPAINGAGQDGLENYRAFCRGRSLAFETAFGRDFTRSLPAASAVGTVGHELTIAFVAGSASPRHFENPDQVPAYLYPPEHGPRPPSFARATVVDRGDRMDAFVSGTSSIIGHSTVAPDDTRAQLDCTLENLARISRASGLGERLAAGSGGARHFKVYLRDAGDLEAVAAELDRRLLVPGDVASYLRADICRCELNVEIEVAVRGALRT
jgi:chorismate lyase/3-hydroxybenzoate synthase